MNGKCFVLYLQSYTFFSKTRTGLEASLRKAQVQKCIQDGFNCLPIASFISCYPERRGTPRQGGIVKSSLGIIRLEKDINGEAILEGILEFSHLWVIFVFHENTNIHRTATMEIKDEPQKGKTKNATRFPGLISKVAPPRLTGKQKVGVFACRTPHRPNPIGLSVVKLERVVKTDDGFFDLIVSGADLIQGTPILDIKPYVPAFDSLLANLDQFDGNMTVNSDKLNSKGNSIVRAAQWVTIAANLQPLQVIMSENAISDCKRIPEEVKILYSKMVDQERGRRKTICKQIIENPNLAAYPYENWEDVLECLIETLRDDIRAPHKRQEGEFEGVVRLQGVEGRYKISIQGVACVESIKLLTDNISLGLKGNSF